MKRTQSTATESGLFRMKAFFRNLHLVISVLALTLPQAVKAQNNAGSPSATFAVVSPARAQSLAEKKDAPEAQGFIKDADQHLAEPPHALARIHLEGTLPHQGIWDQSKVAVADFPVMRDFALAYRLTGDDKYLHALDGYLLDWATTYKISLNPIDETNLDEMIVAYDLAKDALPETTRQKVNDFLRAMAVGYAGAVIKAQKDEGNWQSHRIKMLTLSAYALGDADLIGKAHAAFSQHISVNIKPDGSVFDFYKRDAMHYVLYDLEPLSVACLAAKQHGQDWYNEGAPASVANGVNWVLPFAKGQKTHIEFAKSTVPFDKKRAAAGIGEYAPHQWEPAASIRLLTLATALDPAQRQVCEQVCAATHKKPTDWIVLLFWGQN